MKISFLIKFFWDLINIIRLNFLWRLPNNICNKFFYLINSKSISTKSTFLNWTSFWKIRINGNLDTKSIGILWLHLKVFIESEFDMWEIGHIHKPINFFGLLKWGGFNELAIITKSEKMKKWIDMRSRCKVESCSNMFPIISTNIVLIFPILILVIFWFPKH